MEARFQKNPNNAALQGSHRFADLALDISSALNAAVCMGQGPNDAPDWISWQKFSTQHKAYGSVINKPKANLFWQTAEPMQQRRYVRDLISPYVAPDALVDAMLAEGRVGTRPSSARPMRDHDSA